MAKQQNVIDATIDMVKGGKDAQSWGQLVLQSIGQRWSFPANWTYVISCCWVKVIYGFHGLHGLHGLVVNL
jgi:hypothetical protein